MIQDYCLDEKLPPLTILVINQSGKPGEGFIAWDIDNYEEGFNKVIEFNWSLIENPFSYASDGARYDQLVTSLVDDPEDSEEVYAKVKARGVAQVMFRDALLKAYKERCAFTNLSFVMGLQAAHIIPWSKASRAERLDVRNGILLNSFHHSLFDQGLITITNDYKMIFSDPEMKDGSYSKYDKLLTIKLHMQAMALPQKREHWPLPEYIRRHHEIHEWDEYLPTKVR